MDGWCLNHDDADLKIATLFVFKETGVFVAESVDFLVSFYREIDSHLHFAPNVYIPRHHQRGMAGMTMGQDPAAVPGHRW